MLSANNMMINDKFSCIKEITKIVPIALSTAYQGNEITGISNVLDSWKRHYIPQLQGVVVSYKDISLMSMYAYIKSDYPIIHCNVKATFVLFVPVTGSIVKGKINRISHNYVGCLVHNTINVAVHRYVNEVDDSHFIALDQEILFEITDLNFKRKIVRVKGKITQECIKLMDELQIFTPESDNTTSHLKSLISSSDEDSEKEHENIPDSGLESENQSQSLLRNNVDLFSSDANNLTFSPPKKKKKKSHKHQTESSPSRSLDSLDAENEDESQSLLSSYNKESNLLNSVQINPTSPKKKKKKTSMEKKRTYDETFTSFSLNENSSNAINNSSLNDDNTTDSSYSSHKKKKSQSSSTKTTSINSVNSNSTSPKKKTKKAVKKTEQEKFLDKPFTLFNMNEIHLNAFKNDPIKEDNTTDSSFSSPKKKKSKSSTTESTVINSVNCNSVSPKKKKKEDKKTKKEESFQKSFTSFNLNENSINAFTNNYIKEDNTTDTGYSSPKKKKNKPTIDSLEESLTLNSSLLNSMFSKEDSTDTSSHLSSSSKKKKRKKSKENLQNSPSLFSDSLSSSKEDSTPFKVPKTPKKKHKRSEDKVSTLETTLNEKNSASLQLNKDIKTSDLFHLSQSPLKSSVKEERFSEKEDNFMEFLSAFDPMSENHSLSTSIKAEPLDSDKKAKKRKLESPDKERLATKKKKTSENKNKLDKLKKKSKEKSKKDSKKDKKKKKIKVISSKKKLPKLKKEKKEKGKKSKKKKSKKSSKEKKSSML